ncbi:hypothetical protein [Streptomyces sp. NPDC015350]|uniref:hypothetical protein n=1 Tax=Streptomyces sp. NPDC015350 TaxID=3364955 RepID=UPI0036F73A93
MAETLCHSVSRSAMSRLPPAITPEIEEPIRHAAGAIRRTPKGLSGTRGSTRVEAGTARPEDREDVSKALGNIHFLETDPPAGPSANHDADRADGTVTTHRTGRTVGHRT